MSLLILTLRASQQSQRNFTKHVAMIPTILVKRRIAAVKVIFITCVCFFAYRIVLTLRQSQRYVNGYKTEGVESMKAHMNEATHLLGNDIPLSPVCRKPLLSLWSQFPQPPYSRLFPTCSDLILDVQKVTYWERKGIHRRFSKWRVPFPHNDNSMFNLLRTCEEQRRLDFPSEPASKEEAAFPLAYVYLPSKNLAQSVRLFRMIYQPQNAYCINYDTKSSAIYKEAILSMASCFPNVYLNPYPEPIHYARFSLLHSVMECMKVLRNSTIQWRYVQVVSWNDFPLKTNWEMVKIFKALNGSQDSALIENNTPAFILYEAGRTIFEDNGVPRPVAPDGITIYKGSFANSLSRRFVDFMFTDPVSIRFYDYFKNRSTCAEEYYWTSLIHNIQLNPPGSFPGQCLVHYSYQYRKSKPSLSRFQVWDFQDERRCLGKYTNTSCVFGVRDVSTLLSRMELFAHKLYEEFQPAALYCLEEWYWQRVCMGQTGLNITYYENLPSVIYHNLPASEKEEYVCTLDEDSRFPI